MKKTKSLDFTLTLFNLYYSPEFLQTDISILSFSTGHINRSLFGFWQDESRKAINILFISFPFYKSIFNKA